jgi:ubiquitin-conjugating enzyme E2 M
MQKDMSELKMEKGMELDLCNGPEDLMNFKINVSPDDGMYKKGKFVFDFKVPKTYPHDPPKVQCETTVFHPNIDMEGHVCLNILREDWKPVLTIQSVIMGLQFLMLEPNADDPLNKEAAQLLSDRPQEFARTVRQTFQGRTMQVGSQRYTFPKFE